MKQVYVRGLCRGLVVAGVVFTGAFPLNTLVSTPASAQEEDIAQLRKSRGYEPLGPWKVGDKVEVERDGKWVTGTIAKIDEKGGLPYFIDYDSPKYTDWWAPVSEIRTPVSATKANAAQAKTAQDKKTQSRSAKAGETGEDIAQYRKVRGYEPLGRWKVGDKVEVNFRGYEWAPGTIVAVEEKGGLPYIVRIDGNPSVLDRRYPPSEVRARTGKVLSPTAQARKQLAALKPLSPPKPGSLADTFQRLIRARYEWPGKQVPAKVTFHSFRIGNTHKYTRPAYTESPDGPGGKIGTTVYPVHVQYTVRETYRDAYLTNQYDAVFSCFKDAFGRWRCNLSGGRGIIKNYREERADYKP